jgi:hypothetical protein
METIGLLLNSIGPARKGIGGNAAPKVIDGVTSDQARYIIELLLKAKEALADVDKLDVIKSMPLRNMINNYNYFK